MNEGTSQLNLGNRLSIINKVENKTQQMIYGYTYEYRFKWKLYCLEYIT